MLAWRKEAQTGLVKEEELNMQKRHTRVQQVSNVQFYVLSVATL